MDAPRDSGHRSPNWSGINQWLLWIGLAAAVVWLFYRHNEHLLNLAPLLLVLACPLMHLFGHGGHRHGSQHDRSPRDGDRAGDRPPGHQH
jgi:hypothetical protein